MSFVHDTASLQLYPAPTGRDKGPRHSVNYRAPLKIQNCLHRESNFPIAYRTIQRHAQDTRISFRSAGLSCSHLAFGRKGLDFSQLPTSTVSTVFQQHKCYVSMEIEPVNISIMDRVRRMYTVQSISGYINRLVSEFHCLSICLQSYIRKHICV